MKTIICGVLLFTVFSVNTLSLTKEQKAKVKQYHAACLDETKVDPELVKKARKGSFAEDDGLKKFALCFLRKADLVNTEGKINEEVALSKLPPDANKEAAKALIDLCKNTKGSDPADTAFKTYKCYYESTPRHISLI